MRVESLNIAIPTKEFQLLGDRLYFLSKNNTQIIRIDLVNKKKTVYKISNNPNDHGCRLRVVKDKLCVLYKRKDCNKRCAELELKFADKTAQLVNDCESDWFIREQSRHIDVPYGTKEFCHKNQRLCNIGEACYCKSSFTYDSHICNVSLENGQYFLNSVHFDDPTQKKKKLLKTVNVVASTEWNYSCVFGNDVYFMNFYYSEPKVFKLNLGTKILENITDATTDLSKMKYDSTFGQSDHSIYFSKFSKEMFSIHKIEIVNQNNLARREGAKMLEETRGHKTLLENQSNQLEEAVTSSNQLYGRQNLKKTPGQKGVDKDRLVTGNQNVTVTSCNRAPGGETLHEPPEQIGITERPNASKPMSQIEAKLSQIEANTQIPPTELLSFQPLSGEALQATSENTDNQDVLENVVASGVALETEICSSVKCESPDTLSPILRPAAPSLNCSTCHKSLSTEETVQCGQCQGSEQQEYFVCGLCAFLYHKEHKDAELAVFASEQEKLSVVLKHVSVICSESAARAESYQESHESFTQKVVEQLNLKKKSIADAYDRAKRKIEEMQQNPFVTAKRLRQDDAELEECFSKVQKDLDSREEWRNGILVALSK